MGTATSAGTDVGSPPTVLVVEDETALADAFVDWLRRDYDVRVAYSGEAALEIPADTPSTWSCWTGTCRTSPATRCSSRCVTGGSTPG